MSIDEQSVTTRDTRAELDRLIETFRKTTPNPTRRDLMRWSAIAAGAVAATRIGIASAAPAGGKPTVARFQDNIVTDAKLTIPFDPWGQDVTLDPHRTVNWGPFWVMFPNVWGGLLRYDQNGKPELDLAESMDLSDDGETYTFKIKPDLPPDGCRKIILVGEVRVKGRTSDIVGVGDIADADLIIVALDD